MAFDRQAVSRRTSRGPVALVGLAAVLVGLLAFGAVAGGRPPASTDPVAAAAATPRSVASVPLVAVHPPPVAFDAAFVDLRVGARTTGSKATARQLVQVDGRLDARAERLTIRLETHDEVIVVLTRDVSDPNGGIRPTYSPTFEAEFDLTALGATGPLWVAVAAYDRGGGLVARVRRAVPVS